MSEKDLPPENDDNFDFASAMQGVTQHSNDKVDLNKTPRRLKAADDETSRYKRLVATQDTEELVDGLSSEIVKLVESEDDLIFATPGVQLGFMKRLKQGHIRWEAGLDLHGFTLDDARSELSGFIRDCNTKQFRCIIVIHGKAYSGDGKQPLMKSYVNDWLRQFPAVIAFCSAQPKDGGTGALYVLLKRAK
ncbi:MAG: Smr/MutS family protein [Amphritea sp.]